MKTEFSLLHKMAVPSLLRAPEKPWEGGRKGGKEITFFLMPQKPLKSFMQGRAMYTQIPRGAFRLITH